MKIFKFIVGRIKSFKPAFQGLFFMLRNEKNAWVHTIATVIAIILMFVLKLNYIEILFFISAIFLVWITEIINSAFEYFLDFIHKEKNQTIKVIKDLSAASVLLSAFYALVVFGVILIRKLN